VTAIASAAADPQTGHALAPATEARGHRPAEAVDSTIDAQHVPRLACPPDLLMQE
jgi:hypothetical protein